MSIAETTSVDTSHSLSERLSEYALPRYEAWTRMPFLVGIENGTLPREVFRHYLEQDYLYLKNYARLYSRLAFLAPDADVEHFVQLASGIISVELDNHRRLSAGFDCDFENIVPGPELAEYMDFLTTTSADMGEALVSMMPCVTGYGVALRKLSPDNAGDYSGWVAAYTSGAYQDVIDRHCRLVDHFDISYDRALTIIDRALDLEDAFWNQLPPTQGTMK